MIANIRLQNFRLYSDSTFDFADKVNVIVGPNARGKTSLLEGILVLAKGRSYRVKDQDLIKFKKKWARVEGISNDHSRIVKFEYQQEPFSKTITIDGKEHKRLNLSLQIPLVLFEPNDLYLLSGPPDVRRDYLDTILSWNKPGYATTLRKYNRALAQRNALLKNISSLMRDRLFPWDIRLSQLGGQIATERCLLIELLNKQLPTIYQQLSSSKTSSLLDYLPSVPIKNFETIFLHKLDSNLDDDLRTGFTRFGPHRDDFKLHFNGHLSDVYASRGELRTATLALKFSELEMLEKSNETAPIFLLDDVFSELDGQRRQSLAKYLTRYQSFLTTTDAELALKQFGKKCKVIPLSLSLI